MRFGLNAVPRGVLGAALGDDIAVTAAGVDLVGDWTDATLPCADEPIADDTGDGKLRAQQNNQTNKQNKTKEIHATKCATKPKKSHNTQFKIKFLLSAFQVC